MDNLFFFFFSIFFHVPFTCFVIHPIILLNKIPTRDLYIYIVIEIIYAEIKKKKM